MNKECVIGIDIGGTNIRIGHTDENGDLADFERISSKETFKDGNISAVSYTHLTLPTKLEV